MQRQEFPCPVRIYGWYQCWDIVKGTLGATLMALAGRHRNKVYRIPSHCHYMENRIDHLVDIAFAFSFFLLALLLEGQIHYFYFADSDTEAISSRWFRPSELVCPEGQVRGGSISALPLPYHRTVRFQEELLFLAIALWQHLLPEKSEIALWELCHEIILSEYKV